MTVATQQSMCLQDQWSLVGHNIVKTCQDDNRQVLGLNKLQIHIQYDCGVDGLVCHQHTCPCYSIHLRGIDKHLNTQVQRNPKIWGAVHRKGLEPITSVFHERCSTNWATETPHTQNSSCIYTR